MEPQDMKAALADVMKTLLDAAQREREQQEPYKELFETTDGKSFEGLLRKAEMDMQRIALDASDILEKHGVIITMEKFNYLMALPYICDQLEKDISAKEGRACCVDKTFHLLNAIFKEPTCKKN